MNSMSLKQFIDTLLLYTFLYTIVMFTIISIKEHRPHRQIALEIKGLSRIPTSNYVLQLSPLSFSFLLLNASCCIRIKLLLESTLDNYKIGELSPIRQYH